MPARGFPTAIAPYSSGKPATSATATTPPPRGPGPAAGASEPPASTAAVAISRLWARTRRSRSITQHVLVQPLVPRHDAVGRELEGPVGRRRAQARVERVVPQQAN